MSDVTNYTQANRAAWNASAAVHENGAEWDAVQRDVAAPGFSVFDPTMTQTLETLGIDGARTVQIGCNNGRELLSVAALGALPVLGIDQSDAFADQARKLAQLAGSGCQFLRADIYDLPEDTPRAFDLAIITIGVLNWMPDLPRFLEVVAGLLAPGGRLVIYETHPMLEMMEPSADDPFALAHSYFRKEPFVEDTTITYDGSEGAEIPPGYWFIHTMGEIVTGCVAAGLQVARLEEHAHSNREVDYDIYAGRVAQMPMSFTLVAVKQ